MSRTSTPKPASVEKIDEVTPGRSLPVSVISRVCGCGVVARSSAPRLCRRADGQPTGEQAATSARRAARSSGASGPAARVRLVRGDRAAVVLQRQVDDRRGSGSQRRQLVRARGAIAVGAGEAGRGGAGSSAGRRPRAATGPRRGRPARRRSPAAPRRSARSASPTGRAAGGGTRAGWQRHTTPAPARCGTSPRSGAVDDDGLADLQRRGLKARGPASPSGSPGHRQREPGTGGAGGRAAGRAPRSAAPSSAAGQPDHVVRGVVADDRVPGVVQAGRPEAQAENHSANRADSGNGDELTRRAYAARRARSPRPGRRGRPHRPV